MEKAQLIEKFLCPGCCCGGDASCDEYAPTNDYGYMCGGHVLGTSLNLSVKIALGLPRGFNRSGPTEDRKSGKNKMMIRLFPDDGNHRPSWDSLNIPVWAMEQDGFLFVRTYCPRLDDSYVDVIENGSLGLVPGAVDVSEFYDDID